MVRVHRGITRQGDSISDTRLIELPVVQNATDTDGLRQSGWNVSTDDLESFATFH